MSISQQRESGPWWLPVNAQSQNQHSTWAYSFCESYPIGRFDPLGNASVDSTPEASLPAPKVAPCKWLGAEKSTATGGKGLALTDVNPQIPSGILFGALSGKRAKCKDKGGLEYYEWKCPELTCSVKILIHPAVFSNPRVVLPGQNMSVWDHECVHATDYVADIVPAFAAFKQVAGWCIANDCEPARVRLWVALVFEFDAITSYRSGVLQLRAYRGGSPALEAEARDLVRSSKQRWNDSIVEFQKAAEDLVDCQKKHGDPVPQWPKLPVFPKLSEQ